MLNCTFVLAFTTVSKAPTCKDDNVDVVFGGLKLIRDAQVAVNIFLSQPGELPMS